MGIGRTGTETNRLVKFHDCLVQPSRLCQDHSDVIVSDGVAGIRLHRSTKLAHGCLHVALLELNDALLRDSVSGSLLCQATQRGVFGKQFQSADGWSLAFTSVLAQLPADPNEVLFIDDRADNTRTAAELGMRTITFTTASALERELRVLSR